MSERDLLLESRPLVLKMAIESSKMSQEQFDKWKRETLEQTQQNGNDPLNL